jgi:hypothetical protein
MVGVIKYDSYLPLGGATKRKKKEKKNITEHHNLSR